MLYPFKFEPVYKDYLWGGRNLENFGKRLPAGIVAESWEISCHPHGVSIVSNGEYAGLPLTQLITGQGLQITGTALPGKSTHPFPLLVKLIDANNRLSVQVHPDDAYAFFHENGGSGKNEMWYILEAKSGAQLFYDVSPGVTREVLAGAIKNGTVQNYLQYIPVSAGDVIYIPAGVVHAIDAGIVLAEIQQNSDITYRVYDYDRVDPTGKKRPLHIEKALEVIDFHSNGRPAKVSGLVIETRQGVQKRYLVANPYFAVELHTIHGMSDEMADGSKFYIYLITAGEGEIRYETGSIPVTRGESVLVPATLGAYTLKGDFQALKTYVPDLANEIIAPLQQAGYSEADIHQKISGLDQKNKDNC